MGKGSDSGVAPDFFANARDLALAPRLAAREADWRIGAVVYQVLVDRFAPSADLDAKRHLYAAPRRLHAWSDLPTPGTEIKDQGLWTHEIDFWGGDIASLRGKLDYLKSLDVDVVYLNPIHQAYTNHKYDAQDYFAVSPEFGTRDDVKALADDVHGLGMKLVLDGVFNHMGRTSPMFQEALGDPRSPWREWYFIGPEYRLGYRAWWDVGNLPDVNWESPAVRARIYGDADSVVKGWLRDGVDGWRLDVAYDIGFRHLSDMTASVRSAYPDALILGEVYNYPADWVGQTMDGIMNMTMSDLLYGFARGEIRGGVASRALTRMVEDADYEGILKSWVVLDNHDRQRLATGLPDQDRRRLAQVLQFTVPGAPNIYYGVETGMTGGDDPQNRAPMDWSRANESNPDFVWLKTLTAMRRDSRALRIGEYRQLDTDRLWAFSRYTDRVADTVIVLANPEDEPVTEYVLTRDSKLVNSEVLRDMLSGSEVRMRAGALVVTVPPRTAWVLRPVINRPNDDYNAYKRVQ